MICQRSKEESGEEVLGYLVSDCLRGMSHSTTLSQAKYFIIINLGIQQMICIGSTGGQHVFIGRWGYRELMQVGIGSNHLVSVIRGLP